MPAGAPQMQDKQEINTLAVNMIHVTLVV